MNTLTFPGLGLSFQLSQIAFSIGPLQIHWYGLIIAAAFLAGSMYLIRKSRDFGLDADKLVDVLMLSVVLGFVGARLYYVVFQFDEFRDNLMRVFYVWEGGIAFYGGILFGFGTAILLSKKWNVKVRPMLDLGGIAMLIAQGIGRWGNFVNIEAFGTNTDLPWGMTSPVIQSFLTRQINADAYASLGMIIDPTKPVHPCFLYESLWLLLGAAVLIAYSKRRKFDGELFLMYLGWNGLGRMFIEGLRTDSLVVGAFRVSQVLAGILVIVAAIGILLERKRVAALKASGEELPLYCDTEESREVLAQMDERRRIEKEKSGKRSRADQAELEDAMDDGTDEADEADDAEQASEADEADQVNDIDPADDAEESAASEPEAVDAAEDVADESPEADAEDGAESDGAPSDTPPEAEAADEDGKAGE